MESADWPVDYTGVDVRSLKPDSGKSTEYFVFGDSSGGSTPYLVVQMIQIRMDRCYSRLILQGCLRSTPYAVFSPTQWRLPRLAVDITEYCT